MQLSSLLEKMWYASAMSSSAKRCVMISLGLMRPAWICSMRRGRCRLTLAWFMRSVSPLLMALPMGTALKVGP
jgi:hypothetical protein